MAARSDAQQRRSICVPTAHTIRVPGISATSPREPSNDAPWTILHSVLSHRSISGCQARARNLLPPTPQAMVGETGSTPRQIAPAELRGGGRLGHPCRAGPASRVGLVPKAELHPANGPRSAGARHCQAHEGHAVHRPELHSPRRCVPMLDDPWILRDPDVRGRRRGLVGSTRDPRPRCRSALRLIWLPARLRSGLYWEPSPGPTTTRSNARSPAESVCRSERRTHRPKRRPRRGPPARRVPSPRTRVGRVSEWELGASPTHFQ
jgi:hypothetical protein